eukprot:364848-Chlamydomonas_euryale.AAC.14
MHLTERPRVFPALMRAWIKAALLAFNIWMCLVGGKMSRLLHPRLLHPRLLHPWQLHGPRSPHLPLAPPASRWPRLSTSATHGPPLATPAPRWPV